MRICIVGAGMAGLACAEALTQRRHVITLLDKGRGPGGRMSTRRLATAAGEASFDHGAQYFTVRDPAFRARVEAWMAAGCVAPWTAGEGAAAEEGAYVGVPGMNAPLRQMAAGLDVVWGARVTAISRLGEGWRVTRDDGVTDAADAVVVAIPAEQAADLLLTAAPDLALLGQRSRTAPCWTVMLAFAERLATPLDSLKGEGAKALGWAARNRAKPGRTGPEAWVVQAGPAWSTEHLEADSDWVATQLSIALAERLGIVLPTPLSVSAHRWRYARSATGGPGAVWDVNRRLGLCGDWLIGPRVEAAWMSGTALAERIGAPVQAATL